MATTGLSSVLSGTGTATGGSAPFPTSTCRVTYEIPVKDAACAVVHSDISDKILEKCCGPAEIVPIDDGCASYCLAQGQDIGSLSSCLYKNGFTGNSVYCNKAQTATASAPISSATSGSSSTGTASGTATTSGTGTATGTGATASSTTGAAVPAAKVSTGGVGVLALLFCSALFGVMA